MVAFYAAVDIMLLYASMLSHRGVGGGGVAEMFCSNALALVGSRKSR